MRTRDEVQAALDGNFKQLMDCLGQLTEEELTQAPSVGDWTVKDVIAHVWSWGDEAVQTIKFWQKPRPWQAGVNYDDAWNEGQVAARRALPLINVVDGVTGMHRRLVHQLDKADEQALEQVGRAPWGDDITLIDFIYEMAVHYADHAAGLLEYQGHCLEADCN
jgi:uncharacterized protein (TIGR03083 family)